MKPKPKYWWRHGLVAAWADKPPSDHVRWDRTSIATGARQLWYPERLGKPALRELDRIARFQARWAQHNKTAQ